MDEMNITTLVLVLVALVLCSAFFSASETSMMRINRYRLRHLATTKRAARRALGLLTRTDRLLGVILIGNTFANILAGSVATLLFTSLFSDEVGVILGSVSMTLILLIFGEITPKTLAALHPERIAFLTSFPLKILLWLLYPLVILANGISNLLLKTFRVKLESSSTEALSREELRIAVNEAGSLIPRRHRKMLTSILDLEKVTVNDIMVPRAEVNGIDLQQDFDKVLTQLTNSQHSHLPVYADDLDNVVGILHLRNAIRLLANEDLNSGSLSQILDEPYFVPEHTPLHKQLFYFQRHKRRIGLVVNEYGDIQGLVTLEDILEEIVGEFTTDMAAASKEVYAQDDGSFLVDAGINIRELNKHIQSDLPIHGPKTLSGLIIQYLEAIPHPGTCILISNYPIEVIQVADNCVKTVKISKRLERG